MCHSSHIAIVLSIDQLHLTPIRQLHDAYLTTLPQRSPHNEIGAAHPASEWLLTNRTILLYNQEVNSCIHNSCIGN